MLKVCQVRFRMGLYPGSHWESLQHYKMCSDFILLGATLRLNTVVRSSSSSTCSSSDTSIL